MEKSREINVRVFRFNPLQGDTEGKYEDYTVPIIEHGMSVLNVLQYISEHHDGGLAYYSSCRRGECAGCAMKVNGKPKLACLEIVNGDIVLEPIAKRQIIKDLLTMPTRKQE